MDTWDRYTLTARVDANKPLTKKQWQFIHNAMYTAVKNAIAKSPKLTSQISTFDLWTEWDNLPK